MSARHGAVPTALSAALADRYRLKRELGAGGMATVHLAHDLKHDRDVAIKVLRPELGATLGAERFLAEIRTTARLQHPHILPLYDSGAADGLLYYVMPYVEGTTLRDRLDRERELPVDEAVRILRDVADGMAAAHAKGVVHRDLKPENVLLSGRHAVVADFGVAKAVSDATGRQRLTTEGVALGTPTYMAPEQATADPLTDHRADIYALGVIAYELLTGQPPFVRPTGQALLAAHVTEAPAAVTTRRASIPPVLAQLVMQCLEKRPADRPQQAEDVLRVLESLASPSGEITPTGPRPMTRTSRTAATVAPRKLVPGIAAVVVLAVLGAGTWALRGRSGPAVDPRIREPVAVLPFEVQGGDPALGVQLADRISSAIEQAGLGAVVRLAAPGRGERFTERIGRRLQRESGAATLVVGTIANADEAAEVRASVVRGTDFKTIWTLGPERAPAGDATSALDAMRERVLGAVGWFLSPATEGVTNPGIYQPPSGLEVLRLANRADELFRTGEQLAAIPVLEEAFARDTMWLPGVLRLATIYANNPRWQQRDSLLAFLEARRGRLYPGDALYLDFHQARLGSPEQAYRAAMALFGADSSEAYLAMSSSVRDRRPEEALRYFAMRDSTTAWGRDWQAWDIQAGLAYHAAGRFEEELALARAAKAREPRAYGHWEREVRALAALGRVDEIEQVITESYAMENSEAPVRLLDAARSEFEAHGPADAAKAFAARSLAGAEQWPESRRGAIMGRNIRRAAHRTLGDHEAVWRIYEADARSQGAVGLGNRILGARHRILMGDTAGVLALVDSVRTQPLTSYAGSAWAVLGTPRYYAAHLLALLGRRDEAVAMLREALNNGWRLAADEPLQWYWAPIKDYPPFQELVKLREER